MNLASDPSEGHGELLFAGFNQDAGCFACGTTNGFIIFNVDPFRETFRRIFPNGGIGQVEMLFRCNLLALVGGGRNPRYPTNKVMIWDDHQNKCIGELKFRNEVKAVRLRRDRIVVVLENKVFVYRFKDLKILDQITTVANPKGLVSLCPEAKNNVLAIPGLQRGSIRIELYDIAKATLIKAHDAELAQFSLNNDGSRIASASEKGTLIRLWNCHTGEPLRELRRGADKAMIYCLAFNPLTTYLAVSSDKGTIHIFSLAQRPVNSKGNGGNGGGGGESDSLLPSADNHGINNNNTQYSNNNNQLNSQQKRSDSISNNTNNPSINNNNNNSSTQSTAQGNTDLTSPTNNNTSNKSMANLYGMNFLKGILPQGFVPKYFDSEWSFGQVRGLPTGGGSNNNNAGSSSSNTGSSSNNNSNNNNNNNSSNNNSNSSKCICAFSKDSQKIHVICSDGSFIVALVEEGECTRLSTMRFMKPGGGYQQQQQHHPQQEMLLGGGGGGQGGGAEEIAAGNSMKG